MLVFTAFQTGAMIEVCTKIFSLIDLLYLLSSIADDCIIHLLILAKSVRVC